MSSIQDSAMHIWVNGETITQDKLEQNRKVFETAINDNQSQISAQYTNAQIDAKVNTASSTTKVVQAGTVFPSSGLVDGQEFYRDDLHIMYIYDAALNKWVDRGSIASQGFRNLLDPSKQSFTRASNATRKDLTPVPYNVLRTEQGKFGQGAFIEEATTEIVQNNDFETITGTATVFSDAMTAGTTADPAWTTQSGSFTYSASGATSGATGAILIAGNSAWKPLTGSNGSSLSLTAQATVTEPATVSTSNAGSVYLYADANNRYVAYVSNTTFYLNKLVAGTWTNLASIVQTISASTAYTITLAITPSGGLTAKLYSGVGTGGTLLQTLTATDTSLTGGFLIGVGGDTGVIIKNAQVTAPFADAWSVAGDQRVAWALTSTNPISGSYSVSVVGISGVTGSINNVVSGGNISAGQTAAYSVFVNGQGVGSGKASLLATATGGTATTSSVSTPTGTFSTQRIQGTLTAGTGNTGVYATLNMNDVGTVVFDAVQIEIKNYATTYVRNDSTSASATRNADSLSYTLSNPLPSRYFGALVWTPEQASSVSRTNARGLLVATDLSGNQQYSVNYDQSTGVFKIIKGGSSITLQSSAITFNALDRIFVAWEDDPTIAGQITLWIGVNSGTLQTFTLANATAITTAQKVYIGGTLTTGYEANGTVDFPIITDILPTADQVQALYQASDWGGVRNYAFSPIVVGDSNRDPITVNKGLHLLQALSGGYKVQSGYSSITVATAGTQVSTTITFPTAFSNSPSAIVIGTDPASANSGYINVTYANATATSFVVYANSYAAQTIQFSWIAIGS